MNGVFIRNITHEINTPLNSIVGFAELAAAPDADDEKRQSYIEIIRENSGYLQKLVDDVLYIAGLESSDPPPALGPVDINVCCMQCIQTVRDYSLRKLDIRFEPECAQLPVNTSCLLLSKALTELLRNAARFAPDGRITTGLGRLPADRRRIGRRGRTRHFLHGRGAFHAHNSNRLNIDYQHNNIQH